MMLDRTKMLEALRRVVQRMHYPLEVMLVCVRELCGNLGDAVIRRRFVLACR